MMVAAMTGPTPNTSVRLVPDAVTAVVSFFLAPASLASMRRRSARCSSATSCQAPATASAGWCPARTTGAAARPAARTGTSSPGRTDGRRRLNRSPAGLSALSAALACPRSGCMTCGTAPPPWPSMAAGADLKVIQAMLGHASIADTYTSVLPGIDRHSAEAIAAEIMRAARTPPGRDDLPGLCQARPHAGLATASRPGQRADRRRHIRRSDRVGPPRVEPGTYGLKVRLPAAPGALPAPTEPQNARNAPDAQVAHGGVSTTVSTSGADCGLSEVTVSSFRRRTGRQIVF